MLIGPLGNILVRLTHLRLPRKVIESVANDSQLAQHVEEEADCGGSSLPVPADLLLPGHHRIGHRQTEARDGQPDDSKPHPDNSIVEPKYCQNPDVSQKVEKYQNGHGEKRRATQTVTEGNAEIWRLLPPLALLCGWLVDLTVGHVSTNHMRWWGHPV